MSDIFLRFIDPILESISEEASRRLLPKAAIEETNETELSSLFPIMFIKSDNEGETFSWHMTTNQRKYLIEKLQPQLPYINPGDYFDHWIRYEFKSGGLICYMRDTERKTEYITDFLSEEILIGKGYSFDKEHNKTLLNEATDKKLVKDVDVNEEFKWFENLWAFESTPFFYYKIFDKDNFVIYGLVPCHALKESRDINYRIEYMIKVKGLIDYSESFLKAGYSLKDNIEKSSEEIRSYALRSSVAAIMSRNKSHIHGSHIEHGLRNKMHTFENRLFERFCSEDAPFYGKIREKLDVQCGKCEGPSCHNRATRADLSSLSVTLPPEQQKLNQTKLAILMENLKEEAHKKMSFYRQRQDDLAARMATEWPTWGCTLDFYTHMILPLKQNPYILHFINLSENFCLKDMEINFAYSENSQIKWTSEYFSKPIEKRNIDLIDWALYLLTSVTDVKFGQSELGNFLTSKTTKEQAQSNNEIEKWELDHENRKPCLVSLRDADIGAQAFFAIFEGIIRNASKHGIEIIDFYQKEFDNASLKVDDLCCAIKGDYNGQNAISSIEDLNNLLRVPNFVKNLSNESNELPKEIKKLIDETKEYRAKQFSELGENEKCRIKRLNRLLLEYKYTDKTPKHQKPFRTKMVFCEKWDDVEKLVEIDNAKSIDSEKYNFIVVSASRDFIKDNDGGERKIKVTGKEKNVEKTLVDFLKGQFKKEVIDETGKITGGNWGLKEIKICSAFVAGEGIDKANKEPVYLWIGKTKTDSDMWEDEKERLCYVVKMEKPKIALAVTTNEPANKDGWQGIRFESNKNSIFSKSTDYDFLYADKSLNLNDIINKYWFALPQRKIVDENISFDKEIKTPLKFGIELYKKTIAEYLQTIPPGKINLRLHFEDDETAGNWHAMLKSGDRPQPITKDENHEYKLRDGNNITLTLLSKGSKSHYDNDYQGHQILLNRHKKMRYLPIKIDNVRNKLDKPYYFQHLSGSDQFFSFLMSIKPSENSELAEYILMQILESTLLNILIIDERIAQTVVKTDVGEEFIAGKTPVKLAEKLYWLGMEVAKNIKIDDKEIWSLSSDDPSNKLVDFCVTTEKGNIKDITIMSPQKLPYHIILIHAERLKKICDELRMKSDEFVAHIREKYKNLHILVHSGRGRTDDIPKNAPFLEYSILERYVISEPSKYYLTQIALSAKGERNEPGLNNRS